MMMMTVAVETALLLVLLLRGSCKNDEKQSESRNNFITTINGLPNYITDEDPRIETYVFMKIIIVSVLRQKATTIPLLLLRT